MNEFSYNEVAKLLSSYGLIGMLYKTVVGIFITVKEMGSKYIRYIVKSVQVHFPQILIKFIFDKSFYRKFNFKIKSKTAARL